MDELVKVEVNAGVATLTVNRPKVLNALDGAVLQALEKAIAGLPEAELRAVIVTGAGEKAFVAGADIAAMAKLGVSEARAFSELGHRVFARLEALPVPVIAAVNGFALGGGLELALCADLIYASEKAKFGQPEVKLGLIPGFGGCVRLGRRVGRQAAAELVLTGAVINASRAKELGLVLASFAPEELMSKVTAIAADIASRGPVAVRAAKRVLQRSLEVDPNTAAVLEQQEFAQLFASTDQREGCAAFVEDRTAQFTGR